MTKIEKLHELWNRMGEVGGDLQVLKDDLLVNGESEATHARSAQLRAKLDRLMEDAAAVLADDDG